MRIWTFLLLLCAGSLFAAGNEGSVLKVGTVDFYPPYETRLQASGGFAGFDMDMMDEICRRINKQCEYVGYRFYQLLPKVASGELDAAISAIYITPARRAILDFSIPYIESSFIAIERRPKKPPSSSAMVGMISDLRSPDILNAFHLQLKDTKGYLELDDLIADLATGKIDKAVLDYHVGMYWVDSSDYSFASVGKRVVIGEGYGIATPLGSDALVAEINRAILEIEADGTFIKLYNKYFSEGITPAHGLSKP